MKKREAKKIMLHFNADGKYSEKQISEAFATYGVDFGAEIKKIETRVVLGDELQGVRGFLGMRRD